MSEILDIGHEHAMQFMAFRPDRGIAENAERFRDVPDDERAMLAVWHSCPAAENGRQIAVIYLRPGIGNTHWTVESWEPLTISPSLLFKCCGDHGFIRGGKWVPA